MFSSLNNSPSYHRFPCIRTAMGLHSSVFFYKKIFLKRSPFKRIESCYKDKIVKNPKIRKEEQGWQNAQKVVLDCFGYGNHTFEDQRHFLVNIAFEEFIMNLPSYYLKDDHMLPQWLSALLILRGRKIYIGSLFKQVDIDQIENKNLIENIIFDGVNFNNNPTEKRQFQYTDEMKDIVFKLYKKDFELLNYS